MKKIVALLLSVAVTVSMYAETIKIDTAYAISKFKDTGEVFKIRFMDDDGTYHDWYVTSIGQNTFSGFEDDDVIVVENLIDIAKYEY